MSLTSQFPERHWESAEQGRPVPRRSSQRKESLEQYIPVAQLSRDTMSVN
jgi:hypothetical protein